MRAFSSTLRAATLAAALTLAALPAAAQGNRPAPLSPRDSVSVDIKGATIKVNYGRPAKRDREIFGALVPWGRPWRTGANEATSFTTSRALQFGGVTVPAGSYTLFTIPAQDGKWQLVVNKQTGQWGTNYDAAQDLVRIPMVVTQTPAVVERLEIAVAPKGNGGELAITWDRARAAAAFTVK